MTLRSTEIQSEPRQYFQLRCFEFPAISNYYIHFPWFSSALLPIW